MDLIDFGLVQGMALDWCPIGTRFALDLQGIGPSLAKDWPVLGRYWYCMVEWISSSE